MTDEIIGEYSAWTMGGPAVKLRWQGQWGIERHGSGPLSPPAFIKLLSLCMLSRQISSSPIQVMPES
ncbi:MAG: hypothetical protein HZA01_08590 [Nitrospinae bacterium]|nr:hypothetical protein [Nitrospinota bacterium]